MAQEIPDLLPCPFCGSCDVEYEYSFTQSITVEWETGWVDCNSCDATGGSISKNSKDHYRPPWVDYDVQYTAVSFWNLAIRKP